MTSALYCCMSITFTAFSFIFGWGISVEDNPQTAAVLGGGFAFCILCVMVAVRTAYHDEKTLLSLIDSKKEKEE